jgi:hypothetical protein
VSDDTTYDNEERADAVLQDESPDRVVVPVTLDEPVNVRELPAISAGMTRKTLDTSGERILAADPKRKSATIVSLDQALYLGMDAGNVNAAMGSPNGARWPVSTPLVLTTCDEVWASSVTSTTTLTIIIEKWAS